MTTMVEHGGLLVPAGTLPTVDVPEAELVDGSDQAVKTTEAVARWRRRPITADVLTDRLAAEREAIEVRRADVLARRRKDVDHEIALADVAERSEQATRSRRDRVQERRESAELGRYYRRAVRSGARARIRADIDRSAEMRALRVAMVRRYAMLVGLPVVVGFAAYSTPGVQHGMVKLLSLGPHSAGWWTAWFVEPLLIAVAVGIIVVKALLRASGGQTDWRAEVAKWGALFFSIALNLLGGWTGQHGLMAGFGEALGHSVGAIGAAVVAWLIGVIVDYASKARPWDGDGVQRLAEMGLGLDPAVGNIDATRMATRTHETDDGPYGVDATRTHETATRTHGTAQRSSEPVRTAQVVRVAPEGVRDGGGEAGDSESQRTAARMAWIAAYRSGVQVSGAELGRVFGWGERWGQNRVKEAREELARRGETPTTSRVNGRHNGALVVAR